MNTRGGRHTEHGTLVVVSRFVVPPSVHTRSFDGELVVLDLARGDYFALDEIGAKAWNAIVAGKSLESIAAEIAHEYDVPESRAAADLVALRNDLLSRGLLVEDA